MAIVTAKENASLRTKNRIAQFGPEFTVGREAPDINIQGTKVRARLLSARDREWVGWVAADEINISKADVSNGI